MSRCRNLPTILRLRRKNFTRSKRLLRGVVASLGYGISHLFSVQAAVMPKFYTWTCHVECSAASRLAAADPRLCSAAALCVIISHWTLGPWARIYYLGQMCTHKQAIKRLAHLRTVLFACLASHVTIYSLFAEIRDPHIVPGFLHRWMSLQGLCLRLFARGRWEAWRSRRRRSSSPKPHICPDASTHHSLHIVKLSALARAA